MLLISDHKDHQSSRSFSSLPFHYTSICLSCRQCHAIAAAIFGDADPEHYEIVETNSANRFADLDAGAFDVLISTTTHTLSRDVELGLTFSAPYYYDGMRFAGPKGDCADMGDLTSEACSDLKVCVSAPTTHYPIAQALLPEENILPVEEGGITEIFMRLESGECNALASEGTGILLSTALENGYTGKSDNMYSRSHSIEPINPSAMLLVYTAVPL